MVDVVAGYCDAGNVRYDKQEAAGMSGSEVSWKGPRNGSTWKWDRTNLSGPSLWSNQQPRVGCLVVPAIRQAWMGTYVACSLGGVSRDAGRGSIDGPAGFSGDLGEGIAVLSPAPEIIIGIGGRKGEGGSAHSLRMRGSGRNGAGRSARCSWAWRWRAGWR